MSTDTYIDVNLIDFKYSDEYHEGFYKDESYSSLRIGHVSHLINDHYDIYKEFLNLNWIAPKLSLNTVSTILKRYMLYLQMVDIVNITENVKLKDNLGNYGCNQFHKNCPLNDFVSLEILNSFLNRNNYKYWQIRVD